LEAESSSAGLLKEFTSKDIFPIIGQLGTMSSEDADYVLIPTFWLAQLEASKLENAAKKTEEKQPKIRSKRTEQALQRAL
jgi:hypothetical protein